MILNKSLLADFSSNLNTVQLQQEINDSNISVNCVLVRNLDDEVKIVFESNLTTPETTALDTIISNHLPNTDSSGITDNQIIQTSEIISLNQNDPINLEGILFNKGQISPNTGFTGIFSEMILDADINILLNIENNNIKDNAQINATKIADGSITNTEFQYLNGLTSNIQGQINNLVNSASYFHCFDSTGGLTFTGIPITVEFDSISINSGDWSLSNGELTAQNDNTYLFIFDIGTEGSSGNSRSSSDAFIELNTGSGFNEIAGSRGIMYNRLSDVGDNSTSISKILEINDGDIVRVRVVRHTGGDSLRTRANCSRATIIRVETSQGPSGPIGPTGADGDITWEGEWVNQNYNANQAVSYLGSSYVCHTNTNSNQVPSNPNFWDLLAQKGATGAGSTIDVYKNNSPVSGTPFSIINFNGVSNIVEGNTGVVNINFNLGFNHFGPLSSDPTGGSYQPGDKYFNITLNHEMFYDQSRNKWLSTAVFFEGSGLNGSNGSGSFYRRFNGLTLSTTIGPIVQKGTIIGLSFNNANSGNHTYEILVNGSVVSSLTSGGSTSAFDDSKNDDFETGIMSSRNASGSDTTSNFQGTITYRLRA